MPRFLALEWNETQARAAVAVSRAGRIAFEHAFTVDLRPEQSDGEAPTTEGDRREAFVGERIAAALAARRITRVGALVAIGRSEIELRRLSLPPAPDDELPELVGFQAMREFNVLGEDWPLDFLPIDSDPEQPRNVLAAAIKPELVAKIQETCQAAGLKPSRLVLRPCAAASLVCRQEPPKPGEVRLLVDLLAEEADLTVMVGEHVVFLRRARLHGDPVALPSEGHEDSPPNGREASEALVSEVRRTMVAAQNQLRGERVESVLVCGSGQQHTALVESIREQIPAPVDLFDPFGELRLEGDLRSSLPDHPDRFAPLLGMLWDELDGTPHAFDFLHPRRRPEPPSRRNTYALAGLAAALLVVLFLGYGWLQSRWLEADIKRLNTESTALDRLVEQVAETQDACDEIEEWLSGNVVWLDELRWLSEKFPDAEDAMLTQVTLSVSSGKREIAVDGQAKSVEAATKLDRGLQDPSHRLVGKTKSEDQSKRPYPVQFKSSLSLVPQQAQNKQQQQKGDR